MSCLDTRARVAPGLCARPPFKIGAVALGVLMIGFAPAPAETAGEPLPARSAAFASTSLSAASWSGADRGGIDEWVFRLALGAAACAVRAGVAPQPQTLTVIDYSKPSTDRRLWVFDLRSRELLYEELVAHGQGSGENFATRFSNEPDTHRSSLGLFATDNAYVGKHGYSLRLRGLDEGFNDRAYERAIVMHGASYVSTEFVRRQGRLGRSWGCPALDQAVAGSIIDQLKNNSLVFAYYPDPEWLAESKFVGRCTPGA